MLKQLLSIRDVNDLRMGNRLSDNPEKDLGKTYTIQNVAHGLVYAINDSDNLELRVLATGTLPLSNWWVYVDSESVNEVFEV